MDLTEFTPIAMGGARFDGSLRNRIANIEIGVGSTWLEIGHNDSPNQSAE